MVQLREKEAPREEIIRLGRELLAVTQRYGALLIINDHPAVAKAVGADGAHVGREDPPVTEACALLGPDAIIGLSTHDEAEVRAAESSPVSYINIGPMFATGTKEHLHHLGTDEVLRLSRLTRHPWTTMGGIKRRHLPDLFRRGIRTVSMVTEISLAKDVEGRVRELLDEIGTATRHSPQTT
jgi:thiamine-phosphate pyrophosphorylase